MVRGGGGGANHLVAPPSQSQASSRSGSDKEPDRVSVVDGRLGYGGVGVVGGRRPLGVAAHLAQSRESFQLALDNPCQYFVGVL